MTELLEALTPPQREAVQHVDGPLLILAGPGSGKTRVVTHRIAHLLEQGIAAERILALTFTNKAAEEMAARVTRLAPGAKVWSGTFHRFCAGQLRRYARLVGLESNYSIYDANDSVRLLKRVLRAAEVETTICTPEQISGAISRAKNNLIVAQRYGRGPGTPLGRIVAEIYPRYQAALIAANAVDFDDLLLHVATLLREQPEIRETLDERFAYILVDEYQDTNLAQYAIVRALSIDFPNLSVTGDPDQSIYGWRGANIGNILEFENDYPQARVVRLECNYRSTGRILSVADALIRHNRRRKSKELYTQNEPGRPVRLAVLESQKDEAEQIVSWIADDVHSGRRRARDFAVFFRVNALSRAFESALRAAGVPFQMVSGFAFYERREIKDVLAYLSLLNNPRDNLSLLRIINTPPRGISKATVERISKHAVQHGMSMLDATRDAERIGGLPKRAGAAVTRFVTLYDQFLDELEGPVEQLLGHVMSESGYHERLSKSNDPDDQERLANIEELLSAAREYDETDRGERALEGFLEEASLVNETDAWEASDDRVTLMSLHASKGLEFPVVFIVALEQGILPHERSTDHEGDLEEERRLLFVGITRAKEILQLSRVRRRQFRGQRRMAVPSSFMADLPMDEIEIDEQPEVEVDWDAVSDDQPMNRLSAGEERQSKAAPLGVALTTADQLLTGSVPRENACAPEEFHQGMAVEHPEYGAGHVVALGGGGALRSATVDFGEPVGQKRFVLAHCALQPL